GFYFFIEGILIMGFFSVDLCVFSVFSVLPFPLSVRKKIGSLAGIRTRTGVAVRSSPRVPLHSTRGYPYFTPMG
ncbi:MAG TPA: hypothetical protein PKH79_05015, partial [Prolixibacteraceae bacterium]|nr:hypothetical protein [Prolixibacteraceae bacterium]